MDYGRVAATAVDASTGRAVRIWPRPQTRTGALGWTPGAPDRWRAQLAGYQVVPLEQLLGPPGARVTRSVCGEEVLHGRELATAAGPVCRGCAAKPYYRRAEAGMHAVALGGPVTREHPGGRRAGGRPRRLTG